jgi:hypothetical protein
MILRIPQEDLPAMSTVLALSDGAIKELITAIDSAPPMTDLGGLSKQISAKVPSVPTDRLGSIIDALYSLYYIREMAGVERDTFLEDLVDSVQNNPKLLAPKKDIGKLRARLGRLLGIAAFNTLAKAGRLQRHGERLYCDSQILSDIRPVFGPNPTARPVGAVITHTLKLGYHKGGDHKEFFVILESDDLMALDEVVTRALAKDKALRDLLADAKLPDLGA